MSNLTRIEAELKRMQEFADNKFPNLRKKNGPLAALKQAFPERFVGKRVVVLFGERVYLHKK